MTKSELVNQVAARLSHLTLKEAEIMVDTIFDAMSDTLVEGDHIELRGFGSFSVRHRAGRQGRNPKTGDTVLVSPKRTPFFKVGKELKKRINGNRV